MKTMLKIKNLLHSIGLILITMQLAFAQQDSLSLSQTVKCYLTGSAEDVQSKTTPGLLLMGGSTDVKEAIAWFLTRSGGGDVVVIRSSGADGYNQYMFDMVPVNSVESIIIDSRAKAENDSIVAKIRAAEALFIAGGDQWNYVNYWKNSPTEDAINYLLNTKGAPVGGTSAGLAVLGSAYFSAQLGGVTSKEALGNPYHEKVALGHDDFLNIPLLENVITDSHYTQRERQGRHIAFMARLMQDFKHKKILGIGIDEKTALCIDQDGRGKVYGTNHVYFLKNDKRGPKTCVNGSPLTWNHHGQAVKVYKIQGNATGNGYFNATNWTFSGGNSYFYYVNNGVLY
ncbi:MAG: cyanophycinase [Haliscomenobacter sp.]|uniref:cyanophycinase n=1 Tax=Haliscomenobacter sp. TaxID=2717303 RepID=UPI00299FBBBA|nr:cyanophycinase [Haliscomenobacter sp.]MDX2068804.1 cyanophycinase [Haliscomenobacter sp.]